jgi:hypothetical protein
MKAKSNDQDLRDSLLAFWPVGQGRQLQGATGAAASGRASNTSEMANPGKLMAADMIPICHGEADNSH